ATRGKRPVELAFLRLAFGSPGVRRHPSVVVAHCYNTCSVLACSALGGCIAYSLLTVGQLCFGTVLFRLATQPAISGLTAVRLWSLHPKYLDAKGLVALWREALLAKNVLEGKTTGYRSHPQLHRFRRSVLPIDGINQYLSEVYQESLIRGYKFDREKIDWNFTTTMLPVTSGQMQYERE